MQSESKRASQAEVSLSWAASHLAQPPKLTANRVPGIWWGLESGWGPTPVTFSREELPGMVRAPNLCLPLSSCLSDGGIFFHDDGDFFFIWMEKQAWLEMCLQKPNNLIKLCISTGLRVPGCIFQTFHYVLGWCRLFKVLSWTRWSSLPTSDITRICLHVKAIPSLS